MATRFLLRRLPLSHLRTLQETSTLSPFLSRRFSSLDDSFWRSRRSPNHDVWYSRLGGRMFSSGKLDAAEDEEWSVKEGEILKDVEGTVKLAKAILHSGRYDCGDMLSPEDEKEVVEKLLAYHPHRKDKIGCGMDHIMVDWHPVYRRSRCLFVVRKNGSGEDFSYWKCLTSYVEHKYPYDAERFISLHLTKPGRARDKDDH